MKDTFVKTKRTVAVGDVSHIVYLDTNNARFALAEDEYGTYDSVDQLADAAREFAKRESTTLNIPFHIATYTRNNGFVLRHGTVRKIHGRTRNFMVKWADTGKVEQVGNYSMGTRTVAPLDPEAGKHYLGLLKVEREAQNAVTVFEKEHAINLLDEVRKELGKLGVTQ